MPDMTCARCPKNACLTACFKTKTCKPNGICLPHKTYEITVFYYLDGMRLSQPDCQPVQCLRTQCCTKATPSTAAVCRRETSKTIGKCDNQKTREKRTKNTSALTCQFGCVSSNQSLLFPYMASSQSSLFGQPRLDILGAFHCCLGCLVLRNQRG